MFDVRILELHFPYWMACEDSLRDASTCTLYHLMKSEETMLFLGDHFLGREE